MSEKKRVVFVLHDIEGMPPVEIAKVVGAPVLTVRTRLFYARKELRAAMSLDPVLAGVARDLTDAEPSGTRGAETRSMT